MKIISFYKLLLILITETIHFSEQIKHINESSSIVACKGKDVDLLWRVDEEINKISNLEWYFNNKTICTSSTVEAFTVKPPYQGRIERISKTEIRLKNLSQDDEGIYILHALFEWSIADNMLKIELRILEPPTNKCTCKMGHQPDFTFEETESYCGRPQVSLVWKRKQTFEVLGEGNRILNSTLQDKELLCCQDGEARKCVDDKREFCTTVSIPHRDTERPSEDGNTQRTDLVTMPGTGTGSTNIHHMHPFVLAILIVCLPTVLLTVLLFLIIICKMRKKNKDLVAVKPKHSNTSAQGNEDLPTLAVTTENPSPIMETVQELDTDVKLQEIQVAVEPTHSNTEVQFNKELQQFRTEAATTDRPLQDSNQHVLIVNNISINTDFLKSITHRDRALMAEIQAIRKETRKLKRRLYREKHLRPRYSFEMTPVKRSYFKENDTDSSETSESDDASSELVPL